MTENEDEAEGVVFYQLSFGPAYRADLHREVCRELGFSLEPLVDDKGERVRICGDMSDSVFDVPLRHLFDLGLVEKTRNRKSIDGFAIHKSCEIKRRKVRKVLSHEL